MFLEQRAVENIDVYDSKFNFIREFARHGLGNCPVYYLRPALPVICTSKDELVPVIRFTPIIEETMKQFLGY